MESIPGQEYYAQNKDRLAGLLNTAEELTLFQKPTISVVRRPDTGTEVIYEGQPLPYVPGGVLDYPDDPFLAYARRKLNMAERTLDSFTTMLMRRDAVRRYNESDDTIPGPLDESATEALQDQAVEATEAAFASVSLTYNNFDYVYAGNSEDIEVSVIHAFDAAGTQQGREVMITTTDNGLQRRVTVLQEGTPDSDSFFAGSHLYGRTDPDIQTMAEFFERRGDSEGFMAMFDVYRAALNNEVSPEAERLLDKYSHDDEEEKLREIIELIRQKGLAAYESQQLKQLDPQLGRPDAGELEYCRQLLGSLRDV